MLHSILPGTKLHHQKGFLARYLLHRDISAPPPSTFKTSTGLHYPVRAGFEDSESRVAETSGSELRPARTLTIRDTSPSLGCIMNSLLEEGMSLCLILLPGTATHLDLSTR